MPLVRGFEDRLRRDGRSPAMVRRARRWLGGILADAQERGLVAQNVVYSLRKSRHSRRAEGNGKLKVGVDIPAPTEMRAIVGKLDTATGRHGPVLLTAIFTGLRASELRGLRWEDVDLKRGEIHVRQRADRYNKFGKPKSEAGERTVRSRPCWSRHYASTASPRPGASLALSSPTARAASISAPASSTRASTRRRSRPVSSISMAARNTRPHSLRHFYASWCINRRVDGGLAPLRLVQTRLGHASIQMTADTYGHLFPRGDDGSELAAAERAFLAG